MSDHENLIIALTTLATARSAEIDTMSMAVYLRILGQEHQPSILAACEKLAREPRSEFESALPPVATILNRARLERWNSTKPVAGGMAGYLPPAPDEPTYRCVKCFDDPAGWIRQQQCPKVKCERTRPHGPHYFTARCPCWLLRNEGALMLTKDEYENKGQRLPGDVLALLDLQSGHYRWTKPMDLWVST